MGWRRGSTAWVCSVSRWRGSAVWGWAGSSERVERERERGEMIKLERELRELRERDVIF